MSVRRAALIVLLAAVPAATRVLPSGIRPFRTYGTEARLGKLAAMRLAQDSAGLISLGGNTGWRLSLRRQSLRPFRAHRGAAVELRCERAGRAGRIGLGDHVRQSGAFRRNGTVGVIAGDSRDPETLVQRIRQSLDEVVAAGEVTLATNGDAGAIAV